MSGSHAQPVHVVALFPEVLGLGGVQEAGRLTALALHQIAADRGWSYSLFGLNDPSGAHGFQIANTKLVLRGFDRAKARFVLDARREVRRAPQEAVRLVIAAHPNLGPIAASMQRSNRTRAIVMAHGIEVWKPLPLVRRAALRRASLVTGPSADTVEKLIRIQKAPPSRVRRLPWPLNPDFLQLADSSERQLPMGFPAGRVILSIGRAASSEKYKGTDTLIRAVAELQAANPDVSLVAIGGGDDVPRLQLLADQLGIRARVHFFQGLSREEVAACYAQSDVFAMPSAGEGFGFVFLEAMAFGNPIIAAAAGGALDLVQHEVNGLLVPPHEPARLAAAVARLLQDEPLRRKLGSQGRRIVSENYSFDSFRSNLEHLLEECAPDLPNRK